MAYRVEIRNMGGTWSLAGDYLTGRTAWVAMRDLGWRYHWPTMRLLGPCGHVLACLNGFERVVKAPR